MSGRLYYYKGMRREIREGEEHAYRYVFRYTGRRDMLPGMAFEDLGILLFIWTVSVPCK
jgi:hypothetical protein